MALRTGKRQVNTLLWTVVWRRFAPIHGVDEVRVQEGCEQDAPLPHILNQAVRLLIVVLAVVELDQHSEHVADADGGLHNNW